MKTSFRSYWARWEDTWKPGAPKRVGLIWAGRALIGFPISAVAGLIGGMGCALWHLPNTTAPSLVGLWKIPSIGPNLKVLMTATSPIVVAVTPLLTGLGGILLGSARGIWQGPIQAVKYIFLDSFNAEEEMKGFIRFIWNYKPEPLPVGKEPFDIKPLVVAKALAIGLLNAVNLGLDFLWVAVTRFPKTVYKTYNTLWFDDHYSNSVEWFILKSVASVTVIPIGLALLVPLSLLSGVLGGLAAGTFYAYKGGLSKVLEATRAGKKYIREVWSELIDK